jgi:hypothetical protein
VKSKSQPAWGLLLSILPLGSTIVTGLGVWLFTTAADGGLFPRWYSVGFLALSEGILVFASAVLAVVAARVIRRWEHPLGKAGLMAAVAGATSGVGLLVAGGAGQPFAVTAFVLATNGLAVGLFALILMSRPPRTSRSPQNPG